MHQPQTRGQFCDNENLPTSDVTSAIADDEFTRKILKNGVWYP